MIILKRSQIIQLQILLTYLQAAQSCVENIRFNKDCSDIHNAIDVTGDALELCIGEIDKISDQIDATDR